MGLAIRYLVRLAMQRIALFGRNLSVCMSRLRTITRGRTERRKHVGFVIAEIPIPPACERGVLKVEQGERVVLASQRQEEQLIVDIW